MPDVRLEGPRYNNQRATPWLAAVLVVALFAGVGILNLQGGEAGPAPNFALTSTGYENGTLGAPVNFTLEQYRGKTVVLDMMAVNCAACRIVTKESLIPLQSEFGNRTDFLILSIDTWADAETGQNFGFETREQLIELQQEEGVPWRHALDTDDVWRKYQAIALPKVVVVDAQGDLVYDSGIGQPKHDELRDAVVASLSGEAEKIGLLQLPLFALAAVAGLAAFFAPCSVGLIPAYLGLLLGQGKQVRVGRTLAGGLATAAGVVSLYGVLAVGFWLVGDRIPPELPSRLGAVTGFAFIAIGLLMLRTGLWDGLARRMGMGRVDGRKGFFAFGVGFGLASFGCTGPAFLPILFAGFLEGTVQGFGVFALYAASLALLMLLAATLVATGRTERLRALLAKSTAITKLSAALFVLAGIYLVWFHYRATGNLL